MNRMKQYFVCMTIAAAVHLRPNVAQAQSPFDGTWKTDLSQAKFSPKPLTFYISQGWYHCVTCDPLSTWRRTARITLLPGNPTTRLALPS